MDKQGPQTTKLARGSAEQNQLTRKGPFSQQTTVFSKFIQHVKVQCVRRMMIIIINQDSLEAVFVWPVAADVF